MSNPKPESLEDRLVAALGDLAAKEDRAALAQLRASLAEGRETLAYPFVARFFWPERSQREHDDVLLVSQLFALHPEHRADTSLAKAMSIVASSGASASVELRFRALLDADREDVPTHLRHAVSLLRSHGQAFDFADLFRTLRRWHELRNHARRRWAQDFWSVRPTTDA
jgi:CRISPR system Cascade subunit CasB